MNYKRELLNSEEAINTEKIEQLISSYRYIPEKYLINYIVRIKSHDKSFDREHFSVIFNKALSTLNKEKNVIKKNDPYYGNILISQDIELLKCNCDNLLLLYEYMNRARILPTGICLSDDPRIIGIFLSGNTTNNRTELLIDKNQKKIFMLSKKLSLNEMIKIIRKYDVKNMVVPIDSDDLEINFFDQRILKQMIQIEFYDYKYKEVIDCIPHLNNYIKY